MRFTEAEFEQVREQAGLAGAAVGAWIGERVLAAPNHPAGITRVPQLMG